MLIATLIACYGNTACNSVDDHHQNRVKQILAARWTVYHAHRTLLTLHGESVYT